MNEPLDTWFAREILVHEAPLVRFLRNTWPSSEEVHDLRQETYLRVYEAAAKECPHSAKAFLFTTAKHLIADRARRKRVVSMESGWDVDALNVLVDEISPERCARADEELRSISEAFDLLPPRCKEVVWMRRVEDKSQKEVAARLGIGEAMVEKRVAKAMRRLADALFGGDFGDEARAATTNTVREGEYAREYTD